MRLCRFEADGPRVGILRGRDHVVDVLRADERLDKDLLGLACDPDSARRLNRLAGGVPPEGSMRRIDKATFHAPVEPGRVVLAGGATADLAPEKVIGPGGTLPAGDMTTGVAAVVRHRIQNYDPDDWALHIAGFTPFIASGDCLALGPAVCTPDTVPDIRMLRFGAFVDDLSRIRPTKALMDWGGEIGKANEAKTLRAADLVCLAAPLEVEAGEPVRATLSAGESVLSRLVVETDDKV